MQAKRIQPACVRLLATLILLLTGWLVTVAGTSAQAAIPMRWDASAHDATMQEGSDMWTARIQVRLCDSRSSIGNDCTGSAGIAIEIRRASGALVGTCKTSIMPSSSGILTSACIVDSLPSNETLVVRQVATTIPAGYAPTTESLELRVDDAPPRGSSVELLHKYSDASDDPAFIGGANERTLVFTNVRTTSASSPMARYDQKRKPSLNNGPFGSGATTGSSASEASSTADSAKTWTASVQVRLCDETGAICHGESGIVVNIYLASGEFMGTCTTGDPVQFPGGDMISTCSVDGMPFNNDFVAVQDASTVPAGYVPDTRELTLHVTDVYPGGGDQATFTFTNILAGDSSGSSGASQETVPMMIGAMNCDSPAACRHAIGAHFTVTTEGGEYLGECTLEGHGDEPYLISCVVQVPKGIIVVVTEDVSSISQGYSPEENPIYFDTSSNPVASFWGVVFHNSRS